ncbi:hypothetical protein ACWG5P_10600 [Streptomyces prasinus]
MRGRASGGALASTVEITSTNVQRGDIIEVGGQQCRVIDLFQLPGGARQLVFESGERLTMHPGTRLLAVRILRVRGGDPTRAFSPRRYRR